MIRRQSHLGTGMEVFWAHRWLESAETSLDHALASAPKALECWDFSQL